MSIDISSKLMLVPQNQEALRESIKNTADEGFDGDFHTALESLGLTYASPWFDADIKDWDIGVELPDAALAELWQGYGNFWGELETAELIFFELCGPDEPLFLRSFQHVY
jgi:hypothetical protein